MVERMLCEAKVANRTLRLELDVASVREKLQRVSFRLVGMRTDTRIVDPERVDGADDIMTRCIAEIDSAADTMLEHLKR